MEWRYFFKAVNKDNIDIIKYLHKKGCPWNELVCAAAEDYNHPDIIEYAYRNGCPGDVFSRSKIN
jgi:hypothetical protein